MSCYTNITSKYTSNLFKLNNGKPTVTLNINKYLKENIATTINNTFNLIQGRYYPNIFNYKLKPSGQT